MDQTTDQITDEIGNTREHLRSNFEELESKVKSVTDWRHHYQNHPGTLIAAAFATGALVSLLSSGGTRQAGSAAAPESSAPRAGRTSGAGSEALAKWTSMKSALVGVAAARITGYLDRIVPGFHDELKIAETRRTASSNGRPVNVQ